MEVNDSLSEDFSLKDIVIIQQQHHPPQTTLSNTGSTVDVDFCFHSSAVTHESPPADELFCNGKILPVEIKIKKETRPIIPAPFPPLRAFVYIHHSINEDVNKGFRQQKSLKGIKIAGNETGHDRSINQGNENTNSIQIKKKIASSSKQVKQYLVPPPPFLALWSCLKVNKRLKQESSTKSKIASNKADHNKQNSKTFWHFGSCSFNPAKGYYSRNKSKESASNENQTVSLEADQEYKQNLQKIKAMQSSTPTRRRHPSIMKNYVIERCFSGSICFNFSLSHSKN